MSRPYSRICLIANPKSSNGGPQVAEELRQGLASAINEPVTVHLTERAGHAAELAQELLVKDAVTLLVSVSGDGGYHELINGAMASRVDQPFCAVYGAGNANDHHEYTYGGEQELIERITTGKPRPLDLIRFEQPETASQSAVRYAHSYGGLGLAAEGAKHANQSSGALAEAKLVFDVTTSAPPVRIRFGQRVHRYDHLVFFNIGRMAKFLKVRHRVSAGDGQVCMVRVRHRSAFGRATVLLQAATVGLKARRIAEVNFEVMEPALLQLDGEVIKLTAKTVVNVTAAPAALRTF